MRYYCEAETDEISRETFEETLKATIKDGKQFNVRGIAKDAFLLKIGEPFALDKPVTDEQAGRLFTNIIHQIDTAIDAG